MNREFDWTEANENRLRALWVEGHSTAEIGRRMGVSKNSVVGKAHRLGLEVRPSPIIRDGMARAPRQYPLPRAIREQAARLAPLLSVDMPPPPAPPPLSEKGIANLSRAGLAPQLMVIEAAPVEPLGKTPCCWPLWGTGKPTHKYCGSPSRLGRPYCPSHHALAYTKPQREGGDMAPWVRRDQGLQVVA